MGGSIVTLRLLIHMVTALSKIIQFFKGPSGMFGNENKLLLGIYMEEG